MSRTIHQRVFSSHAGVLACLLCLPTAPGLAQTTTQATSAPADRRIVLPPTVRTSINRGLAYLAGQQTAAGAFRGLNGHNSGVASLAVLAFLSTGETPERGPRGDAVARGIDFVLSLAHPTGLICNPADTTKGTMYEHALSTLLLAEAFGVYHKAGLRDTLERAVRLIVTCQNSEGGWRYEPRPADADISVTVMQLAALRAATQAGIRVPRETFEAGIRYVKRCAAPQGGFLYQPGVGEPGYARTAAGVCSLLTSGEYSAPEVIKGLQYLQDHKTRERRDDAYRLYGFYYAAQAMYLAPDENQWAEWFPVIRDELLVDQQADGHWEGEAGPIYGTAMSVLTLSIPCRYLPAHQH
ncbi:MAG TPA: prenyltransferase/squalene oxidase repeat-containing protein [Phycisphaerae bacterium]|nr:prenyltransferase/squalene oxidase repeat-containing protein [Phycisphaerae bacterium]